METLEGLNELIKNRLIEKKGNVKLTENTDIILYGKSLGITENQLLFKILEIEETIDWSQEKENIIKPESFTTLSNSSTLINIIYCGNCNALNDKEFANFCRDCGTDLRTEPIKQKNQYYPEPNVEKKSNAPYIIAASALIIVVILMLWFFSIKEANPIPPVLVPYNKTPDTLQVGLEPAPISGIDTTSKALSNSTQTSQDDALKILLQYYYDINNSNFDASNYFSEYVSQFITRHNVTPNDINIIFNENNEFLRGQSQIINNRILFEKTENNISYYIYWVDYNCYRRSKNKNQFCKVNVEVGFNKNNKIVNYKELKIIDLRFEEVEHAY